MVQFLALLLQVGDFGQRPILAALDTGTSLISMPRGSFFLHIYKSGFGSGWVFLMFFLFHFSTIFCLSVSWGCCGLGWSGFWVGHMFSQMVCSFCGGFPFFGCCFVFLLFLVPPFKRQWQVQSIFYCFIQNGFLLLRGMLFA